MYSRSLYIPSVMAVVFFLLGLFYDIQLLRLLTKPVPILILIVLLRQHHPRARVLLGALIFSVLGDIILELPTLLPFAAGLASFLIAHILYIRCFLARTGTYIWWPTIPILLYCGSLFFWMRPGLGSLLIPVALYILVISTMLWSACVYAYNHRHFLPLVGAIVFAVSDSMIAINRFIAEFDGARYGIIITYWIAQYLIFSILSHNHET